MGKCILKTINLTKKFKNQVILNNVSMNIQEGTIYGFLGPNGAGKSTTLKLLTGLLNPSSGKILFNGSEWKRSNLRDIGALIESPAFYGNLTAEENLSVHTKILNLSESRITGVLNIVNLKNTGKKKAGDFSLGMKQRLGIAIALLNKPKLLILDEPTNGLDPIGVKEFRKLIKQLKEQGITIILSSHVLSEVEQLADYIGIISNGQLKYENRIEDRQDLEKLFMNVIT